MAQTKNTPLLTAYLIVGDDVLKRETVLARLNKRLEAYGDMAFNSDAFDGESASGEVIVAACNTVPFASEKRLVTLTHADGLKKADTEPIVAYLESPNETTVLALVAEKLAKNTRLYKAVAALGKDAVIDCSLPKAYELPRQVAKMADKHHLKMDQQAAGLLVEMVGTDTVRLDGELARMALEKGEGTTITQRDVAEMVTRTSAAKPWKLVDAFSERNLAIALETLRQLGESSSPFALITMLANRIREMLGMKSLATRRSDEAPAQALGVSPWVAKTLSKCANRYTEAELIRALTTVRDAEQAMKTGSDPTETLTDWLIETMKKPAR